MQRRGIYDAWATLLKQQSVVLLLVLAALLTLSAAVFTVAFGGEETNFLNCADFENHRAAQSVLDSNRDDPHGLDQDRDGVACEHLLRLEDTR
jgi:hypothetical protein